MNLDDSQKLKVRAWIEEGLKLSDIQKRLISECGLQLTYMEVRFLVDDLKLVPKDPEPPAPSKAPEPVAKPAASPEKPGDSPLANDPLKPLGSKVSVSVDTIPLPGAMVSGKVTFTDGQTGKWFIDETGQLGVAPTIKGYRPPQTDMASFQSALQIELQKLGFA